MNHLSAPTFFNRQAEHDHPSGDNKPVSPAVVQPRIPQRNAEDVIEAVAVLGYN